MSTPPPEHPVDDDSQILSTSIGWRHEMVPETALIKTTKAEARGKAKLDRPVISAMRGIGVVAAPCLLIYAVLWIIDFAGVPDSRPLELLDVEGVVDTLVSFSEVTVGVLGIATTVVAIIVELAATRYTPRLTELFVRDPINVAAMLGFVLSSVLVLWINLSLHGPHFPSAMAYAATVLMSLSLLAILPYFAYVFDFLSPTRVIQRIQLGGSRAIARLLSDGKQLDDKKLEGQRLEVMRSVEQLGDIAANSVDNKDKSLAIAGVNALAELVRDHIDAKPHLPDRWFDTNDLIHVDQDFVAFHVDIVRTLSIRRTWVEMKIFRQYQSIFGDALNKMRDINHLIAIQTRRIGRYAHEAEDPHTLQLALHFLNTFMRAAVNGRDIRTAYNLLNEYRLLGETMLRANDPELVLEIAGFIKFYGQLAFSSQLAFILETAAYDLCALLEQASGRESKLHDDLLELFLDVDREPEAGKVQEASLLGVRKAQIRLATHYLVRDMNSHARRIYMDMRDESAGRLQKIRRELEAVKRAEYWEVSDRGINFEYLSPKRRATLDTFFGWFEQLEG